MKKNIIANFVGKFWSIVSNFLFIPIYIKYLGFESYSIISFSLMITGLMAILDSGLTATLSREFSRKDNDILEKYRIFKNLETGYLIVVAICIFTIFYFANFIAIEWLNVKNFTPDQITIFLKILSFEIGFQLLFRFYTGGLLGLEKQVEANMFQVWWGVIRNGIVVILIIFFPRLDFYFAWQAFSTIIFTFLIKYALEKKFNKISIFFDLKLEKEIYRKIGKFAGGMMLITLVYALSTQLDKIMISRLLSIENLGYYTLAVSLSQILIIMVNPIDAALLPRFTALYSEQKKKEASDLFKRMSVLVSVLVISILSNLIFFAKDIVYIWTGSTVLAEHAYKTIPIVAVAYAMIASQILPYNIAISNGYTKLNNILGLVGLLITIPGYMYFTKLYGVIGAAGVFCIIQIIITFIYLYIINLKFINLNFFKDFLLNLFLLPILTSSLIVFIGSLIPDFTSDNRIFHALWIAFLIILNLIVSMLVLTPIKNNLKLLIKK